MTETLTVKLVIAGEILDTVTANVEVKALCSFSEAISDYGFPNAYTVLPYELKQTAVTFQWSFTSPTACKSRLNRYFRLHEDVDNLATITEISVVDSGGTTTYSYSFVIDDLGDASRARTRMFSIGVKF